MTIQKDTKVENAATFVVEREGHTLGNMVRIQLHRDEDVLFSGYMQPHPLEHKVILKVQTSKRSSPTAVLDRALGDLGEELTILRERFDAEAKKFDGEGDHRMD